MNLSVNLVPLAERTGRSAETLWIQTLALLGFVVAYQGADQLRQYGPIFL